MMLMLRVARWPSYAKIVALTFIVLLVAVSLLVKPNLSTSADLPEVAHKNIALNGQGFGIFNDPETVVVSGGWGSEAGQFGGLIPKGEGFAMGPGSFTLDIAGNIYILDQLNKRVQVFTASGDLMGEFAIESATADYIAVDASGTIYITDLNGAREAYVYSQKGDLVSKTPISETITAIRELVTRGNESFIIDDWTQDVHKLASNSRILDKTEQDKVRATGLWQGDLDSTVKLLDSQEYSTNLHIQDALGNVRVKDHIVSQRRIFVDNLQVDSQGNAYLFSVAVKHSLDVGVTDSQVNLLKVDRDGNYVGELEIPAIQSHASWRPFFVSRTGEIYQMQSDENGLRIVKWML